ncbi:hypothetical protein [Bacillus xiapuensis]|nr:hypothetical protein [Bacillus xiapuensis]
MTERLAAAARQNEKWKALIQRLLLGRTNNGKALQVTIHIIQF